MNGNMLKELREKNGYSREELAKKLFVTKYILQSWEEGWHIQEPSSGEIQEMAEAFNMSEENLCEILDFTGKCDESVGFIDFVDAGARAIKHISNGKKR